MPRGHLLRFAPGLLTLLLLAKTAMAGAGPEPRYIPLSQWALKDELGAPGSEVRSDGITLKIYSPVVYRGPMLDASGLALKTEWLNPQDSTTGIGVRIVYDDTVEESLDLHIEAMARGFELKVKPSLCSGRRMKTIEIRHGRSGAIFKVSSVAYTPQQPAATVFGCKLGNASLQDNGTISNGLIFVRAGAQPLQSAFIADAGERKITVVASAVAAEAVRPGFTTDLELVATDDKGMVLCKRAAKIGLQVKKAEFDLSGADASGVVRWEFRSPAPGVHAAVRGIEVGGLGDSAPPPVNRAAELSAAAGTLRDRLSALLERYAKEDRLPPGVASDLKKVLTDLEVIAGEK